MKKKGRTAALTAVLLAVLCLTGCGKTETSVCVDFGYFYSNVQELAGASELIALVRVGEKEKTSWDAVPATVYSAEVLQTIKGNAPGKTLLLSVMGTDSALRKVSTNADVLPQEGEVFLIFANPGENGVYIPVNAGLQGRYALRNGKVYALLDDSLYGVGKQLNGMDWESVLALL